MLTIIKIVNTNLYPKRDSNPHSRNGQRILSPSCLPFHHSGSRLYLLSALIAAPTQSGKRDSNPRPQPWQGCALPTELFPQFFLQVQRYIFFYIPQEFECKKSSLLVIWLISDIFTAHLLYIYFPYKHTMYSRVTIFHFIIHK